jgi:hypothetical protein
MESPAAAARRPYRHNRRKAEHPGRISSLPPLCRARGTLEASPQGHTVTLHPETAKHQRQRLHTQVRCPPEAPGMRASLACRKPPNAVNHPKILTCRSRGFDGRPTDGQRLDVAAAAPGSRRTGQPPHRAAAAAGQRPPPGIWNISVKALPPASACWRNAKNVPISLRVS